MATGPGINGVASKGGTVPGLVSVNGTFFYCARSKQFSKNCIKYIYSFNMLLCTIKYYIIIYFLFLIIFSFSSIYSYGTQLHDYTCNRINV